MNFLGGKRATPVNINQSLIEEEVIYDYSRIFEKQKPNVYHVNTSFNYRINKRNHSSIWSLQIINLLGTKEYFGYVYNYKTKEIERDEFAVMVPNLSYKIEF